jgi:hypothetical protein
MSTMTIPTYRFAILWLGVTAGIAFGQSKLTLEEKERFLETARILKTKTISEGITGSIRASMSDGVITHDAHIQKIDERKAIFQSATGTEMNFRDSYVFNIAAYRLARLLGVDMVPPSVQRKVHGQMCSVTWWVDDYLMTEKQRYFKKLSAPNPDRWNCQIYIVRVFDQLIYNTDRNLGNLVIDKNWNLWMIDHTRAFRLHKQLKSPEGLVRCDRKLMQSLRSLDRETVRQELRTVLTNLEIDAILARRDLIVKHFDGKTSAAGGGEVLYDFLLSSGKPLSLVK